MRRILLMVALLGCGVDETYVAKHVCRAGDPRVDAAVYGALTATSWIDSGCLPTGDRLPPTCNRITLGGDGSYTWNAFSDYPERQQSGAWNFRARDTTSGVVCLDDGSVIDFALAPTGQLRWGPLGPLERDGASSRGAGPAVLREIAVDPLFVELTAHPWANTSEMELYYQPTSFALRDDGTFDATFRGGACTTSGTFSLTRERIANGTQMMMWSRPGSNMCDLRSGGTQAFVLGDVPRIEDGVLFAAGATFRDASIATDERFLAFSSYGNMAGLTVSARWTGALRVGAATSWAISLGNDGKDPQTLTSLHLELTPILLTGDGFIAGGPTVTAVDRPLSGAIAPGASLPLDGDLAFTPGPAGWLQLHLEIGSSDGTQAFRNQDYFLVELP